MSEETSAGAATEAMRKDAATETTRAGAATETTPVTPDSADVMPDGADITPDLVEVIARAREWALHDPDPVTRAELEAVLARAETDAAAAQELREAFAGPLHFGTAGLRGRMGFGESRMNRAVVIRATAGLMAWLKERVREPIVVVGCDARHGSADFARAAVQVISAAGGQALALPERLPTPVTAYAVKKLGADAGVMVTASHNPAQDNGYKVYLGGRVAGGPGAGVQIVPPVDTEIADLIAAAPPADEVAQDRERVSAVDVVADYVAETAELVRGTVSAGTASPGTAGASCADSGIADVSAAGSGADGPHVAGAQTTNAAENSTGADVPGADLRIVLTPMHGVGARVALEVLRAAGFAHVHVVPEQVEPDPDFPTVAFPNPEEQGALDLAIALAREESADIVLALDPDADRCSAAVPWVSAGQWRQLSGDEIGALLGNWIASKTTPAASAQTAELVEQVAGPGKQVAGPGTALRAQTAELVSSRRVLANSIVSSRLLAEIARKHGLDYAVTLTGFKWIARVPDLLFGYEEAIGFCVNPGAVADKDGVSACALLARIAADLKAQGSSVQAYLDEIAREYGLYATAPLTFRVADLSLISKGMQQLRANPPRQLAGSPVTVFADLAEGYGEVPPTDGILMLTEANDRVVVRPSGTEPKLKCYLEVVFAPSQEIPREEAAKRLDVLKRDVANACGFSL